VDAQELKEIQAPLKARYREDPSSALITLTAQGQLGDEEVACPVATGQAMAKAGLHPATGGDGSLACSGDMLARSPALAVSYTTAPPGSR